MGSQMHKIRTIALDKLPYNIIWRKAYEIPNAQNTYNSIK